MKEQLIRFINNLVVIVVGLLVFALVYMQY